MTRFRGRRNSRSQGWRPQTDWATVDAAFDFVLTDDLPTTFCNRVNLTAAADPEFDEREPETVRRIHGVHQISLDPADMTTYGSGLLQVAVGVGVESPQAIAGGATPCPLTDASWDGWMLHWYQVVRPDWSTGFATNPVPEVVDSKAMRELGDNCLFVAVEAATTGTNFNYEVVVDVFYRWLLSLTSKR